MFSVENDFSRGRRFRDEDRPPLATERSWGDIEHQARLFGKFPTSASVDLFPWEPRSRGRRPRPITFEVSAVMGAMQDEPLSAAGSPPPRKDRGAMGLFAAYGKPVPRRGVHSCQRLTAAWLPAPNRDGVSPARCRRRSWCRPGSNRHRMARRDRRDPAVGSRCGPQPMTAARGRKREAGSWARGSRNR